MMTLEDHVEFKKRTEIRIYWMQNKNNAYHLHICFTLIITVYDGRG